MNQTKQQENQEKGETRTQSILVDVFWVLKRRPDFDGADFLIQIPAASLEELRERHKRIEVFGVVQSKYFENSNQVRIAKQYVEDADGPRKEFFAFLHTNDDKGEDVRYFFTAEEIRDNFYLSKDGNYYCFSLTHNRDYELFKNIPKKDIFEIIKDGILVTEEIRNFEFMKIVYIAEATIHIEPNRKIFIMSDATHELIQKGEFIEITITNKATGVRSSIGKYFGNLEQINYDPVTGTVSATQINTPTRNNQ